MKTIKTIDSQYIDEKKQIKKLDEYAVKLTSLINDKSTNKNEKLSKCIEILKRILTEAKPNESELLKDVIEVGMQYLFCVESIEAYKSSMLKNEGNTAVLGKANSLKQAKAKFDEVKNKFMQAYSYSVDGPESINSIALSCVDNMKKTVSESIEQLKAEAHAIIAKDCNTDLSISALLNENENLPTDIMVAKLAKSKVSEEVLKDIGVTSTYQSIGTDIRKQGNIIVSSDFEHIEDERVDEFVIAYILRYLEAFPWGTVNVHIFDQNTSYLYDRLANCFQAENAGDELKRTVQIHTNLADLATFRDVNCRDIFKKTTPEKPDLYAIYETDRSDVFNLIVLRDGLVDGSGYASADNLDAINSLTKPGDKGHKCGMRFLIIDNSISYEKNMTPNNKRLIGSIYQNCDLKLRYETTGFYLEDKSIEALRIVDDLDVYVQTRAGQLAAAIGKREKGIVSLDDISTSQADAVASNIIYIPVGNAGTNPVELPFSCKDTDGTPAGQCIGYMAIGQSGSGKSSFFHSLVLSGCNKYSPKDLQFWLLDFKNGGASSKYRNSGLPHIKIIAENNKIDDAICLFQMILEEINYRSAAFNKCMVNDIVEYNQKAIEEGLEYFPRIIIAIDEVQEIFREDNAAILQKDISSIVNRMRFAGMHFVMVAQNLCEGKSYMLKDVFLPSASGRICFRVMPDIPRDSGYDEEFTQRKQEISQLNVGEAYVSYGKDTIKKVKMAYISSQDMTDKFADIKAKYSEYSDMKPRVIGSKQKLGINSRVQGSTITYMDVIKAEKAKNRRYFAVLGEDAYRMTPLKVSFTNDENSALLLLGNDKLIASSFCASIAAALSRQNVKMHLFNGDRTKMIDGDESVAHPFMYLCQNVEGNLINNYKPSLLPEVMKDLYSEYLSRQHEVQMADDEDPEFEPVFLIVNDLLGIESFESNELIEKKEEVTGAVEANQSEGFGFNYDIFGTEASKNDSTGAFRETIQNIMSTLIKNGYRYNIHVVLAIKGNSSSWRMSNVISDVNKIALFNTTEYADSVENSYYLKEMLKNISNVGEPETMAVWYSKKNFSKMRPIIYSVSEDSEKTAIDALLGGE